MILPIVSQVKVGQSLEHKFIYFYLTLFFFPIQMEDLKVANEKVRNMIGHILCSMSKHSKRRDLAMTTSIPYIVFFH